MDYTVKEKKKKQNLPEKRKALLELLPECNHNPIEAARKAGYVDPYQAVREARKELIQYAENLLASAAPQAVMGLIETLTSDKPIPQANTRLKAAESILDRTGLGKKETLDVNHKAAGGVFIIPEKRPVAIEGEFEEVSVE